MGRVRDLRELVKDLKFYDDEAWMRDYPIKSVAEYLRLFEYRYIKDTEDGKGVLLRKPSREGLPSRKGYILWSHPDRTPIKDKEE